MKLLNTQKSSKRNKINCINFKKKCNYNLLHIFSNLLLKVLFFVLLLSVLSQNILAQQTGATITNVSSSTKPTANADWNNQSKGYIHTLRLNAEQQDMKWKAYVGNVSSTFVLDDANDYSIYQWNVDSFTGQVYITRKTTAPLWTSISCASEANKITEDTSLGHTSTSADSINRTFGARIHNNITIGTNTIYNNTCYATTLWQNDAAVPQTSNAVWQEIVLYDTTSLLYAVFVENDKIGYRGDGTTYDFQAIVPENATAGSSTIPYYFYLELR
ncbi:MAG: hypothetical protein QXM96_03310 [Candidatus Woesearchaeota archaeon]